MIERYHLDLALIGLVTGCVVATLAAGPPPLARRVLQLGGLSTAVIGVLAAGTSWSWVVVAVAPCLVGDRGERSHPLGRFAPALAVVSLAGVWAAVPDTEAPLVALAVMLPASILWLVSERTPGVAGSAALVVVVVGAALAGSAGWGAAMAATGAIGLVATLPLVTGFEALAPGRALAVLVAAQATAGALMPRAVMSRPVGVAIGAMVVANAALLALALLLLGRERSE